MGGSSNWSGSSMRPRTPRGTDGPAICGKFPSFFGKNYLYITTWIPTCCRNKTKMHPWKVGNFMVPSSFSSFMRLANPRKITLQTKEGWLVQAYHNPEPACPKISTHHEGHEVDVIWKINRKKSRFISIFRLNVCRTLPQKSNIINFSVPQKNPGHDFPKIVITILRLKKKTSTKDTSICIFQGGIEFGC